MNAPVYEESMPTDSVPLWPYLLLLIALVLAWGASLHFWFKPELIMTQSGSPLAKMAYYFGPPLVTLVVLYFAHLSYRGHQVKAWQAQQATQAAEKEKQAQAKLTEAEREKAHQQFSLEVVGTGLAVENLRQMQVWERIEAAPSADYVVPEKRYGGATDYSDVNEKRWEDALQYGAFWFTEKWPIPVIAALPRSDISIRAIKNKGKHPATIESSILLWQQFSGIDMEPSGISDRLLPEIFQFFDQNQDVPALYIDSADGESERDSAVRTYEKTPDLVPQTPFTHTEKMRTAAYVGLMLTRHDRIDWLKPYATIAGDPPGELSTDEKYKNDEGPNQGFSRGEWYKLRHIIPDWPAWAPKDDHTLIPFWDKSAAAKRPFKPTKWIPKPWRRGQIVMFEALPIMGRIHRPQIADFRVATERNTPPFHTRPAGTPAPKLISQKQREIEFAAAWQRALTTLPAGSAPARIFHNIGPSPMTPLPDSLPSPSDVKWHALLSHALLENETEHHPAIPEKYQYNLPKLLGELGATTPFVSISVALMAAYKLDQPMAVVNFHPEGATILMITPPTQAERQKKHPAGGAQDPFTWTPFGDTPQALQK